MVCDGSEIGSSSLIGSGCVGARAAELEIVRFTTFSVRELRR
jgi:hypothetical protein